MGGIYNQDDTVGNVINRTKQLLDTKFDKAIKIGMSIRTH